MIRHSRFMYSILSALPALLAFAPRRNGWRSCRGLDWKLGSSSDSACTPIDFYFKRSIANRPKMEKSVLYPYAILLAFALYLLLFVQSSWGTVINWTFVFLFLMHQPLVRFRRQTFRRDLRGLQVKIGVDIFLRKAKKANSTVAAQFQRFVNEYGDNKIAMIDIETGREWTFREMESFSNQVANYFQRQGYRKGDVVALFMHNCPEYIAIWLGLSKLGVITALINYNLRTEPLGHSITVGNAKAAIVGGDLQDGFADAIKDGFVSANLPTFVYKLKDENGPLSKITNGKDLKQELKSVSKLSPTLREDEKPGFRDVLIYIYTSGTTGLPKAAVISHARFMLLAYSVKISYRVRPEDRLYIMMPMYHSAAGILGMGQVFLTGATAVIRKKFSASRFWEECIEYECTVSQYIGELARYLLAQPQRDTDKRHNIRLMYGNGLRADIWEQFMERFEVKEIGEFYGSTEGNTGLVNLDGKPGSCGFLPRSILTQLLHPVALMKIDPETGELARDSRGLCIRCGPGESGEIIGKVLKGDPFLDFVGYVSGKDTNKKLVKDVYRKGDLAFASGDVLHMDEHGYLFFKDRTGDTFRWKGENVSTMEVESVVQAAAGMSDATVYGVEVPGSDGKAGMAAIVDENQNTDLKQFNVALKEKLPVYARPIFLRICKNVVTTGTYKFVKTDLQKAGFDPDKCGSDRLYYLNPKTGQYDHLTPEMYQVIKNGKISF